MLSLDKSFELILRVIPGRSHFPTQSIVHGDGGSYTPAILRIEAIVFAARIENLVAGLDKIVRRANQVIREIVSRFLAAETELTILTICISLVDLVVVIVAAELQRVSSNNFCEIVDDLNGVVELAQRIRRNAEAVVIEADVRNAFQRWVSGVDRRQ